jgi:hypothetical protein
MSQLKLKLDERRRLIPIIAGLYQFRDGGARGRRVLIHAASLDAVLAHLELDGPSGTVAGDLVSQLEGYGKLAQEPTYDALGALLSYVVTLGELPQEEAYFIAELIVKYSLVEDENYIEKLRTQYGIVDVASVKPAAAEREQEVPAPAGPPLVLAGKQLQQFHQALVSAFSARSELERMVRFNLNERLAEIARDGTLSEIVFALIEWAEAKGRTEDLIRAAYKENPRNPTLRAFVEQVLPDAAT